MALSTKRYATSGIRASYNTGPQEWANKIVLQDHIQKKLWQFVLARGFLERKSIWGSPGRVPGSTWKYFWHDLLEVG